MKYKKLIVSPDNKLVLEDYNLNSSNSEILDLNKSLYDVASDEELQNFIKENAIDPEKIYLICVKEDFGSNDQRIENIPDVKPVYKVIKKTFKKFDNVFFFVYNTFMKNDDAVNPDLNAPSSLNAQEVLTQEEYVDDINNEPVVEEVNVEETYVEETPVEEQMYEAAPVEEETTYVEETPVEEVQYEETPVEETTYVEEPVAEEVQFEETSVEQAPVEEEIYIQEVPVEEEQVEEPVQLEEFAVEETPVEEIQFADAVEEQQVDPATVGLEEFPSQEVTEEVNWEEVPVVEIPTEEATPVVEVAPVETTEGEIDWDNIPVVDTDQVIVNDEIVDVEPEIVVEATPEVDAADNDAWANLEATNEVFENETMTSEQLSSPYDQDIERFNEIASETANDVENNDIVIPETYFNEGEEEQISYEDYNEFQNDYELNVHALKSIYDFIWRMLVLNNYNLKLNDLLYLSVNNLDAFSIGQSDFVRQTANRAESLFDLILQLDIKLEFNNSLFYIYLAELFTIKSNKIVVNKNFLNTLSIWVNKASKDKFVSQVEQFINYSTIYNKKIIFAYFIELSNFIKGCIPTISPALNLVDIHRILTNPNKTARKDNIFAFMIGKMNEVFKSNGIVIESDLVETPDNMFVDSVDQYLDDVETNWKTKLCKLYKRLMDNIRNYVLSKGNNESEIFNIYVDIKDLRMYKGQSLDSSLTPNVIDAFNHGNSYITIGDAFERTPSIVPTQTVDTEYDANSYVAPTNYNLPTVNQEPLGNNDMESKYIDSSLLQPSRPTTRFNSADLEDSMTKRIEEYEKKIKENIARIEAERKNLKEKMEALKNL